MLAVSGGMSSDKVPGTDQKSAKKGAAVPATPRMGIKTPGVLIPFASLKAEIEFPAPANPDWMVLADSVYLPDAPKSALDRISPRTPDAKFLDPIGGLKQPCGGVVNAFGSLWVPVCEEKAVVRVDPKTAKSTAKLSFGTNGARGAIAATADSIWMLTDTRTTMSRIDPVANEVVSEFRLPADCAGLTFAEASLWVACPQENRVLRIAPESGLVDKSIEVSPQPKTLVAAENSIWVLCQKEGKVERIDPKTNKSTATIDLGVPGVDGDLGAGESFIWVTQAGFPLTRIDPRIDKVVQQFYGDGGGAVRAGGGFVWLSNVGKGTLWKIDSRRILATLAE
jgi:DNA-binding beta-propeller fold protein YncE